MNFIEIINNAKIEFSTNLKKKKRRNYNTIKNYTANKLPYLQFKLNEKI